MITLDAKLLEQVYSLSLDLVKQIFKFPLKLPTLGQKPNFLSLEFCYSFPQLSGLWEKALVTTETPAPLRSGVIDH